MMQSAWLGLLDDQQLRGGVQRVSLAKVSYQETDIGVKPIHAHVGMTGMVSASLRHDAEFTGRHGMSMDLWRSGVEMLAW